MRVQGEREKVDVSIEHGNTMLLHTTLTELSQEQTVYRIGSSTIIRETGEIFPFHCHREICEQMKL